ncbi:MAG: tRNA lysidine(34) synthetase TilS [Brevinema sp.]
MRENKEKFFDSLSDFFSQYSLSYPNIALAVSGGADSMFLLHTCAMISKGIVVLHVNHQTRKECCEESNFIRSQCKHLGIDFVELLADNLSLEMPDFESQARQERYRLFLDYGNKFQITHLLTAHHRDDLVETVLLKLFRSSPNMFIPISRLLDYQSKIQLFRPMLDLPKSFIESYLLEKGVLFKEDISNNDLSYLRNYLRLAIIPLLKKKIPYFDQKIVSFSRQRQEEANFLIEYIKEREKILFPNLVADVTEFLQEHRLVQQGILRNKIRYFLGQEVSQKQLLDMIKKIETSSFGILFQDSRIKLVKEYEKIKFIFENHQENLEKNIFIIHNKKIYFDLLDWEIHFGEGLRFNIQTDTIYLRYVESDDRIAWNLGSKKINHLLVDKKIPRSERKLVYVMIKNDQIVGLLSTKFTYIIPPERDKQQGLVIKSIR